VALRDQPIHNTYCESINAAKHDTVRRGEKNYLDSASPGRSQCGNPTIRDGIKASLGGSIQDSTKDVC